MTLDTLVAPVSALLGVGLGGVLGSRRERRNWLRDRKSETFLAVASAARAVLWRGDEIDASRADATLTQQRQSVRSAMFTLREQLAAVELIAGQPAVEAARRLEDAFGNHLFPYFAEVDRAAGDAPEVARARQALVRFQQAARKDLTGT